MLRLTFGKVKSLVANVLNLCSTDDRVLDYVNRACERLLYDRKAVQTVARYRVCLNKACITWPRQLETIEAYSVCDWPGTVRNWWYEFLDSGPGGLDSDSCAGMQLIDRGDAVAFDDVIGSSSTLAISVDVAETTTEDFIVQFWDVNGNWIRTQDAGVWIDGEILALPVPGNYSTTTNQCAPFGLVRVIKPVTNGVVRLWEYDGASYRPLAYYEPDETIPVYRRSLIPGLNSDTTYRAVTVMGKLRHIPATGDNSFLVIGHSDAIRLACQAIAKEEKNLPDEAVKYWQLAFDCLEKQARHWHGDGATVPIRVEGTTFGPVEAII
jgi:hypothetical protein